jgi:hypothetical protein
MIINTHPLLKYFHGVNVFKKIDLKHDYHQFHVKEQNILRTNFKINCGHYEFIVLSF